MSATNCNKIRGNHVPIYERPRERMLAYGSAALADAELLAILLRTGTEEESAYQLAQRLLSNFEDLRGLSEATQEELTTLRGIGPVKAAELRAAFELGKRLSSKGNLGQKAIRLPRDVADIMIPEMRDLKQEHFVCLFLNTKNRIIGKQTIFVGSLDASIVHPREVFKEAIKRSSAAVICLHNHPSGDPTPSREDIEVTRTLRQAGEVVGISVLDHVIIGDDRYISLKEAGYM